MGKKSKQSMINIKPLVFKGSKDLIQGIASSMEGIQATKVIQTYVLENSNLKLSVGKDGKAIFSGVVKWIGNRTDGSKGTVFCVQKGQKDQGELRLVMPTEDTAQGKRYHTRHCAHPALSPRPLRDSPLNRALSCFL